MRGVHGRWTPAGACIPVRAQAPCHTGDRLRHAPHAAVAVFAVIKRRGQEPRLIIVQQFRPPLGKYTVELPAGLVDPGESPEVGCALGSAAQPWERRRAARHCRIQPGSTYRGKHIRAFPRDSRRRCLACASCRRRRGTAAGWWAARVNST